MTLILNYFLISLIIFFLSIRINKSLAITALIPFAFYSFEQISDLSYSSLIFTVILCLYPIINLLLNKKIGYSTLLVQLALPWFLVLATKINVMTEVITFIVGLRLLILAIGDKPVTSSSKLLRFEANYNVLLLIIGIIISILVFIIQGNLKLNIATSESSLVFVISSIGVVLFFLQLNAFGSFSIIKENLNKLDTVDIIYLKLLNLVIIPFLMLPIFKRFINIDLLNEQLYFILILLSLIPIINFIEFNRRRFFIGSYNLPNFNVIIISTLLLFKTSFSEELFVTFLILNFLVHIFIKDFKFTWFFKYSYLTLLLPIIFTVIFNPSTMIINEQMNIWGNLIFSLFMLFPLFFMNKYRNVE